MYQIVTFIMWVSKLISSSCLLSRILSCGIWPALPLTGYWLLTPDWFEAPGSPLPGVTRFALRTTAGIVVWSGALLLAAAGRFYRGAWFGLAGWAVVLVSLIPLSGSGAFAVFPGTPWTVWDRVLAAGLLLAGGLYLGFPRENLVGGCDMMVYANHGIFISRKGRLDLPYPWQGVDPALADALLEYSAQKDFFFRNHVFLGFQKNGPGLTPEFGPLWPVWLAQAFATAGPAGLFRLNGVFALLAASVFYGLCLTVVSAPLAVVATVFLALLPSQVWVARTTLSEVFTQLALCAGLLLLLHALKTGAAPPAFWAGTILSFSALIRCDCLLLLPLALTAQLIQSLVAQPAERFDLVWLCFQETAGPGFVLAIGYFFFLSRPYFWKQLFYFRLIGVGSAIAAAALLTLPHLLDARARIWLTSRTTAADLVGVGAALLAAYAYWVRPHVIHYRIEWPEYHLHGKPYRAEYSLRDLGRYLSPVVLGAAIIGGWLTLREGASSGNPWLLPWLTIAAGYAVLYLYDPYDDPGHFLRVRRYVPVVIPGFLYFAAIAGARGLDPLPQVWRDAMTAALLISLTGFNIRRGAPFWWRSEDKGTWDQLRSLAGLVPPDEPVFATGRPEWMTPLYVSFDRRIVPLNLEQDAGWELLALGVADEARRGKPAYLLLDNCQVFSRQPREIGRVVLSQQFLERTDYPVPSRFVEDQMAVALVALTGPLAPPDPYSCALGGSKVWGVEESGFHEECDGAEFLDVRTRWTNGHARLTVQLADGSWPHRIKIGLASSSPTGSRLRVVVNGHVLRHVPLSGGRGWCEVLSLANVPVDRILTIELISNSFVPSTIFEGSPDERSLGVRVREVRLLSGTTGTVPSMDWRRSEPGVVVPARDTPPASTPAASKPSLSTKRSRPGRPRRQKPTIAYFSPLPPQETGVSDYSAALLMELRKYYSIDLFHDSGYVPEFATDHGFMSCDHRLFDRLAAAKDYHAIVYQMGNSHYHQYMFPEVTRHPGLVTLHDFCLPGFHLHYGESRGLGHGFIADELRRWYPEDREAIEDALATWSMGWDFVRECVTRGWHLNRRLLHSAQVMVVHSPWCSSEVENRSPHLSGKIVIIPHGSHAREIAPAESAAVRERFRLPQEALIFGSFGFMNAEKMNVQAIEAFAALPKDDTSSMFVFVGDEGEDWGETRLRAEALGLGNRVRFFGRQPAEAFAALITVTDVGVNLRLPPTNGETSGALLNLLSAGVPTIVTDVATFSDYPASVVRKVSWENEGPEGLRRAMHDLSTDPQLRLSLGRAARHFVASHHEWSHVGEQYVAAIERCYQITASNGRETDRRFTQPWSDGAGVPSSLARRQSVR